jgi:hypothetical protein
VSGTVDWKVGNSETHASAVGSTNFVFTLYSGGAAHYEPFVVVSEATADKIGGEPPRLPQAACEVAPLFQPGSAVVSTAASSTEDPWSGERGDAERTGPMSTPTPQKRDTQGAPSSQMPPRDGSGRGASAVARPVSDLE